MRYASLFYITRKDANKTTAIPELNGLNCDEVKSEANPYKAISQFVMYFYISEWSSLRVYNCVTDTIKFNYYAISLASKLVYFEIYVVTYAMRSVNLLFMDPVEQNYTNKASATNYKFFMFAISNYSSYSTKSFYYNY